jgi:molybdopterin-guanine dinucleotide biosynthesis protein A
MRIAAVILAGGKGERLGGVNKALLAIAGERFVDRAMAVSDGCSPRLLAVGRAGFEAPAELVQVRDLDTNYAGPLAGVAAAVAHLAGQPVELLFSLAVDTPLFPRDFVSRALPLLDTAPAVLAAYDGQDYPTNALWRLNALTGLPGRLRAGTAPRSLKRLAEGVGAARLDYAPVADFDPFRNANTPEDLAFLRARAARDGGG